MEKYRDKLLDGYENFKKQTPANLSDEERKVKEDLTKFIDKQGDREEIIKDILKKLKELKNPNRRAEDVKKNQTLEKIEESQKKKRTNLKSRSQKEEPKAKNLKGQKEKKNQKSQKSQKEEKETQTSINLKSKHNFFLSFKKIRKINTFKKFGGVSVMSTENEEMKTQGVQKSYKN